MKLVYKGIEDSKGTYNGKPWRTISLVFSPEEDQSNLISMLIFPLIAGLDVPYPVEDGITVSTLHQIGSDLKGLLGKSFAKPRIYKEDLDNNDIYQYLWRIINNLNRNHNEIKNQI